MHFARLDHLIARLRRQWRRHHTRQRLLTLDARLLKDIGLSRAEAKRQGGKPFWKA